MSERVAVLAAGELPPGARATVEAFGTRVALFNVGGELHAINDRCPHHGASLCAGTVGGTTLPSPPGTYVWGLEDRVLRCPWHGWEFDLRTGETLFAGRERTKVYDVAVEDGRIVLGRRRRADADAAA